MEGEEEARTVQGRQGNVTFRPYRDIKTKPLLKRKFVEQDDNVEGGKEEVEGATMAEDLYPELLCHIFSMLDTESKGRVAQVNIYFWRCVVHVKEIYEKAMYQVCKRWRNIMNTRNIWRGCEARLHLRGLNSLVVPSLHRRGITRLQVMPYIKFITYPFRALT